MVFSSDDEVPIKFLYELKRYNSWGLMQERVYNTLLYWTGLTLFNGFSFLVSFLFYFILFWVVR